MKLILAGVLIAVLAAAATAAPAADQAEGTIGAVAGGTVTVTTSSGAQLRVTLTAETTIVQRRRVTLADIKRNDFVGVTARREADGSLTAISINIFPPEFRTRIRQAQFVMGTGNVMTNATVFQNVRRIEGRTLYLRLADSSAVIQVPADAIVLRLTLITPGDLRPGMPILVRGMTAPDGSLAAASITVDVTGR